MISRSTIAQEFRLSLAVGIISRDEIVRWADSLMATEDYDDVVAEICMSSNKSAKELESLLSVISQNADLWHGARRMLGRMYVVLRQYPDRLPEFARFLDRMWINNGYEVPEDLGFFASIEDDYQLAREGMFSSVGRVRKKLLEHLSEYENQTEQVAASDR